MALQQSGTTVPAKNSVVVPCGTKRFGFRKAVHRLGEKRSKRVRRAPYAHLCFCPSFMQQACIVEAFVALGESLEKFFHFSRAIRCVSTKLIGDRQAQQPQRQLVFGLDCEDVAADRLSLFRFIERAVELRFCDGFGNTGLRDGLQLELHRTSMSDSSILVLLPYFILLLESSAPA